MAVYKSRKKIYAPLKKYNLNAYEECLANPGDDNVDKMLPMMEGYQFRRFGDLNKVLDAYITNKKFLNKLCTTYSALVSSYDTEFKTRIANALVEQDMISPPDEYILRSGSFVRIILKGCKRFTFTTIKKICERFSNGLADALISENLEKLELDGDEMTQLTELSIKGHLGKTFIKLHQRFGFDLVYDYLLLAVDYSNEDVLGYLIDNKLEPKDDILERFYQDTELLDESDKRNIES